MHRCDPASHVCRIRLKVSFHMHFTKLWARLLWITEKSMGNSKCDVLEPFICLLERKRNWELCIMNLSFEKGIYFLY